MPYDYFLAHSGADSEFAGKLYSLLHKRGGRVFLDSESLRPGDAWDRVLPAAQRDSSITVVLISENTDESFYAQEEVAQAIELARRNPDAHRVVPVYLSRAGEGRPYGLRRLHSISVDKAGGLSGVADQLWKLRESATQHSAVLRIPRPSFSTNARVDTSGSAPAPRGDATDSFRARDYVNRARKLAEVAKWDEAARMFEKGTALDATDALALRDYGWLLLRSTAGKEGEALTKLDMSIRLDRSDAVAHAGRGMALHGLRLWDEAVAAYYSAIELEPGISIYHRWCGVAFEAAGRLQDALNAYDRAIGLAPTDRESLDRRSSLRRRMPKPRRGRFQ